MTPSRTSERVIVSTQIRRLINWALPLDSSMNIDYVAAPQFPSGENEEDEGNAIKVLKLLPRDEVLQELQEQLLVKNRRTEAKQVSRLRDMRWHSVNLLEAHERYDVLDKYDKPNG